MQGLQSQYKEFQERNIEILAIVVDPPSENAKVKKKLKLDFEILSDQKREAIRSYKVENKTSKGAIAHPVKYLINAEGYIQKAWLNDGVTERTSAENLLKDIDQK